MPTEEINSLISRENNKVKLNQDVRVSSLKHVDKNYAAAQT